MDLISSYDQFMDQIWIDIQWMDHINVEDVPSLWIKFELTSNEWITLMLKLYPVNGVNLNWHPMNGSQSCSSCIQLMDQICIYVK